MTATAAKVVHPFDKRKKTKRKRAATITGPRQRVVIRVGGVEAKGEIVGFNSNGKHSIIVVEVK